VNVQPREMLLLVVTGSVALFGVSALLGRARFDEWRDLRATAQQVHADIAQNQALVAEREKWATEFDKVKALVPSFPRDRDMTVYWQGLVERVAERHELKIQKQQSGKERQIGDTYELPIEIRECEGKLDAFVHFLFDLQSQSVMVDTRYLRIKPKNKQLMSGRVYLYCAYARDA